MPAADAYDLKFRSFIKSFRNESAALWFLCFYIFIEYIRPQAMYPVLDFLPWGQVALLCAVASIFITRNKALGFGAMDKLYVVFSIIVLFSIIFAWDIDTSLMHWTTYASWILMYICIVSVLTTPNRLLLFAIFFVLINFKLSQHGARTFAMRGFSFTHWGLAGSPGWFHNSGEFALQMVVLFSISLALLSGLREQIENSTRWRVLMFLFPGTAMLSVIGSSSRGGQLALIAVVLMLVLKGKNLFRNLVIFGVLATVAMYIIPEEQLLRFKSAGEDATSELRLIHWEHAIDVIKNNPMGIGYQNWAPYYSSVYQPERIEEIHNTVLESFVELGYPGGALFLIMILVAFVMNRRTRVEMMSIDTKDGKLISSLATGVNLGLLGTLVSAMFMSVLFYPMLWLAFAMTSALRHMSLRILKEIKRRPENSRVQAMPLGK